MAKRWRVLGRGWRVKREADREGGRQHAAGSKQVDVNSNTVSNGEVMQSKPATN